MVLWIVLSAAVITLNKYIMYNSRFPYPVALTLAHMGFCSVVSFVLIKTKTVQSISMDVNTYVQ